jgi:hypothetical protein
VLPDEEDNITSPLSPSILERKRAEKLTIKAPNGIRHEEKEKEKPQKHKTTERSSSQRHPFHLYMIDHSNITQ